ncbi:VOC family protein [Mycolicibacterium litorale]|uniref:VOC family protein n=1 Tax=Mycolicibacterium litorale TaxID=758802 RepID=UPI003CF0AAC1
MTAENGAQPNNAHFAHPFHHIGILVPDIHEAMERLGATLGLTFRPPRTFADDYIEDPEPRLSTTVVTFSLEGPPYLELIEVEKGVWGPEHMGRLHHIGLWTPSESDCRRHLLEQGVTMGAKIGEPGSTPFYYSNPDDLYGIRIELCDTGEPGQHLNAWLNSDPHSTETAP